MKVKGLILFASALTLMSIGTASAQNKVEVKTVKASQAYALPMPIMMDTLNLANKKFGEAEALKTLLNMPSRDKMSRTIFATDTTNYLYLSKAKEGHSLQTLAFQITSNRYSKPTLKVQGPGMFEVYVDGKLLTSKTTVEDSLRNAKPVSKPLTMLPGVTQDVRIKYMSSSKNKAEEAIKILLEPAKKDKLSKYTVSYDKKRMTNIVDIIDGVRLLSTSTSPSGQYVLLRYKSVASGGAKPVLYTELLDTHNNRTVNLGNLAAKWLPSTDALYYRNKQGNSLNLIKIDPATMQETLWVEDVPLGMYVVAPDEKTLIYTEKESFDNRKGDLKILGGPDDRQAGYYDRYYLYKYDIESGMKIRLTFGKEGTSLRDISTDSRYILFSTTTENITVRPFRKTSLYRLDLQTLALDTLYSKEGFARSGYFSPDGKKILITAAPEAFKGIGLDIKEGQIANSYDTQAYIMTLSSKEIEPISIKFNPSIKSVEWHKPTNTIYMATIDEDRETVYAYNPSNKKYQLLKLDEDVVTNFSLASNGTSASYMGQSVSNSSKAYNFDLKNKKSTLLSDPTKPLFDQLALGEVKDWNFKASDGTTIKGRYYLPPNFDASKKYPMIVYYYSGTTPTARVFEHPYSFHAFAAQGYVVYTLQPSGTIGFGQEFSARHVNAWGIRTADDIIEGTSKFANDHSFISKDKIGCLGASYGGFMTMYLQTRTDIFAAAISHAGISALSSYWGEGYWGYSYSSGASAHSYPWNNQKMYVEQSPLFNADKVNTPLLLLHGTADTNVPMGESIQMYTALKILGKPVEFIQVKDENHGIAKYERRMQWNYSIYSWFAKWLKNDSDWWNDLYPSRKDN